MDENSIWSLVDLKLQFGNLDAARQYFEKLLFLPLHETEYLELGKANRQNESGLFRALIGACECVAR
jgi:hypothetical protein